MYLCLWKIAVGHRLAYMITVTFHMTMHSERKRGWLLAESVLAVMTRWSKREWKQEIIINPIVPGPATVLPATFGRLHVPGDTIVFHISGHYETISFLEKNRKLG